VGEGESRPAGAALAALAPLLLYDGTCGLCDRAVRFTFTHDRTATIRAAPLDGPTAAAVHQRFPWAEGVDSVLLLERDADGTPRLLARSDAAIGVARRLGGLWGVLGTIAALVPRPVRDVVYGGVARVRYRIFGRVDACALPPPAWRARLLP
jgi:predicted DCC family thiol-disulfide oxidoreductase YuxK